MVKVVGGRVLSQVQDMRKALDKAIKGTDSAEAVMDILTAIEILPMTPDLIKESKLGKILISARTKFAAETSVQATEVSNKARDILIGWKKIMEDHMKKEKDEKEGTTEKTDNAEKIEKTEITQKTEKKSTSPEGPVKSKVSETTLKISLLPSQLSRVERIRTEMGEFPEARRKVVMSSVIVHEFAALTHCHLLAITLSLTIPLRLITSLATFTPILQVIALLTGYLKLSTASSSSDGGDSAEIAAYTVDKAVDGLHSFDLDNKAYMGLVRSLAFNLKRNEVRIACKAHEFTGLNQCCI